MSTIPIPIIFIDEGLRGAFGSILVSELELHKKQSEGGVSMMQAGGKQVFAQTCQ